MLAAEIMSSKELSNQSGEEIKGPSYFSTTAAAKSCFFSFLAYKKNKQEHSKGNFNVKKFA